jgi:hypothetical protein
MNPTALMFTVMITLAVILMAILLLIDSQATPLNTKFNVICLDGVEYWYRQVGYKGMIAVKYDADGVVSVCK